MKPLAACLANTLAWALLAGGGAGWLSAQSVRLSTLEGALFNGELQAIEDGFLVLDTSEASKRVPLRSVHRLDFAQQQQQAEQPLVGQLELVDGSHIAGRNLVAEGGEVTCKLDRMRSLNGDAFTLPWESLRAWVVRPGTNQQQQRWREIRNTSSTRDLLVVRRRGKQSLDFVEVLVTQITKSVVSVELDGEPIDVSLSRVYGMVFFRPDVTPVASDPLKVGYHGGQLNASKLKLEPAGLLQANNPVLGEVLLEVDSVQFIDFSRGGFCWLADLQPESVAWTPAFGTPAGGELTQDWATMRRNQSYAGGPMQLVAADGQVQQFQSGLALLTNTRVVLQPPEPMQFLRATIGLPPESSPLASVTLIVRCDGQQRFSHAFKAGQAPFELELPISGVRRLELDVQQSPAAPLGGSLHLANGRFTK